MFKSHQGEEALVAQVTPKVILGGKGIHGAVQVGHQGVVRSALPHSGKKKIQISNSFEFPTLKVFERAAVLVPPC